MQGTISGRDRVKVVIAKSAAFCFGVRRAVESVERELDKGETICTLGELMHNRQAVEALEKRGAHPVDTPEEADTPKVAIRSHGVTPDVLEELKSLGHEVLDLTCPFVARIHELVRNYSNECGAPVVVVGKRTHPEVIGTCGWGRQSYVVADETEAAALPEMQRALLVAQTTCESERFERVRALLETRIPDLTSRNTVCSTSRERQREAMELASRADMMIVVGGKGSANTRELYEICRARTNTIWVETARDLPEKWAGPWGIIGITAGASTPDGTFKEVAARMNDIEKQDVVLETAPQEEPDFEAAFEKTMVQIHPGDIMKGKVVQITDDEVCVNIGYKSDGLIKKSELSTPDVKIGDEIEVEVVKVNDGEGNVILSQKNIVNKRNWDAIMAKYEAGEYVDAVGKKAVKGGLIASVMGVEAFIPASHLSQRYVEKIEDFVGKDMKLKIIEVDEKKKRIVASRKEVLIAEEAKKKAEIWDKLEVGTVVNGIVRRLTDFGAFVDIGGVDGMVHISELSWSRIKNPAEVVSIGDHLDVYVISFDPEKRKISLGVKDRTQNPWDVFMNTYKVGDVANVRIVKLMTFGAFAEVVPGVDGLIHISQIADRRIDKPSDVLSEGQMVDAKITAIDEEKKKISLSIRALLSGEEEAPVEE